MVAKIWSLFFQGGGSKMLEGLEKVAQYFSRREAS
jgi:hypothetical protein